jgi:hypothetical protein
MTTLQAFALGIMIALMPSFLVFAVILWRAPAEDDADRAGLRAARRADGRGFGEASHPR